MSTPFLMRFTRAVVTRLTEAGQLEIRRGSESEVVLFVATRLAALGMGHSLVSSLVSALMDCPAVLELYADDDDVKDLITDLEAPG